MIDINDLRTRPDAYKKACKDKRIQFNIEAFIELDTQYKELLQSVEKLRAEQNAFNKIIPKLSGPEKDEKLTELKSLSKILSESNAKLREVEEQWKEDMLRIPSIPDERVPVGKDDKDNAEIKKWGEIRQFKFTPKDHVTLGLELDIIDIERGVKISGTRNYFLKGDGARLQHAVMNMAIDYISEKGYTLFDPPHIVKYSAMEGTGYFPDEEGMAYELKEADDKLFLIGTSEVSVCSYHRDEILKEEDLPKRYAGYSPCYRREAGSYGKDTHGLYRVHQFYKVEQVVICKADIEETRKHHTELLQNAENMLQSLKIPYRIVICSTGDMGRGQVYKNDIEAWMPSRNAYGETHSCSSFYEFQARRLGIRYKDSNSKNRLCHTLNNTLIASTRIIVAILEQYQQEDGSVIIPEALRPYMRGQERIVKK
jgi:seryl-tRNA synthetase